MDMFRETESKNFQEEEPEDEENRQDEETELTVYLSIPASVPGLQGAFALGLALVRFQGT